ncbi:MAG: methyltransferase C-terminal domain-containing protein, partial [Chloroflexota bacterium]
FDTIYHEHVSYFSLHALEQLFRQAGLRLADASLQAVHGGTLRTFAVPVAPATERAQRPTPSYLALQAAEREGQVLEIAGLRRFAQRAEHVRQRLAALIAEQCAGGTRLAAYGATAKGNTLLGYCGLTNADVEYIADRSPLKQGRLTPGARIPIVSPDYLAAHPPHVLLLLAWNLADEIRRQLAWFAEQGGQFLVPVPDPHLI